MLIEMWPLARLTPYEKNPRVRSKKAVDKVVASIREFGFRQPIVADEAGVILVGHTRRDAAEALGLAEVPVHQALGLSAAQKRAYRIADNRTNEETTWDEDLLKFELKGLDDVKFDLSLTGLEMRNVNSYLRGEAIEGEDDVPEPGEPVTKPGDLWLLGDHRLLCGDATSAEDVGRLMRGEKAGLMNTDPPYGVALRLEDNHEASNSAKGVDKTYRHFEQITGDDLDGAKLQDFLERCFAAAIPVLKPEAAWYLWHAQLSQGFFAAAAAAAAQLLIHRQIIWVKPHFVFGRGDYHWQHELCFYGWRRGSRPPFYGERNQSTTWILSEGGGSIRSDQSHPTQKPVELFRRPLLNHTRPGDLAYDPFAGSGTSLIAAETEGRRCYGLEIEPRYCDVIVSRWEKFTAKTATLDDGETSDSVRRSRAA